MNHGIVYFLSADNRMSVKIGYTTTGIKRRRADLAREYGLINPRVECVVNTNDVRKCETWIHHGLKFWREEDEWFNLKPYLLDNFSAMWYAVF
jgi:hypothetical protein